ncbi:MAG: hypothetical protein EZS28_031672 [Streblomastix strix]|uniref:Uncharacterized protein n=1 Tax=Streblomastix strix TaxID=222440 RepID=A0A5J4US65_9EUKA|nr:MAG: hypothetical protein EZS28_031672 [Streblomastix strix]
MSGKHSAINGEILRVPIFSGSILSLGKGNVVCIYEDIARLLVNEAKFKSQIYLIQFDEIIAINVDVHCATFLIRHRLHSSTHLHTTMHSITMRMCLLVHLHL